MKKDYEEEEEWHKPSEITKIPLISIGRERKLLDLGYNTIKKLTKIDFNRSEIKEDPDLRTCLPVISVFAEALIKKKIIVTGKPEIFEENQSDIYFCDLEYNPVPRGEKNYEFGIFLIGISDLKGNVIQFFAENPKEEKKIVLKFKKWLKEKKPILVAYSSSSADKPHLRNALERLNLKLSNLDDLFYDLFYKVINTQTIKKQKIFLPIKRENSLSLFGFGEGALSLNSITKRLSYKNPKDLKIRTMGGVLNAYGKFINLKDKKEREQIKREMLKYNSWDLDKLHFLYNKLKDYSEEYKNKRIEIPLKK